MPHVAGHLYGRILLTVGLAVAAAGAGIVYTASAYRFGPWLLPLACLAALAVAMAFWRLEWGVALLVFLTPFSENAQISEYGEARFRLALIALAGGLVAVELVRLARERTAIALPPMTRSAGLLLAVALFSITGAMDIGGGAAKLLLLAGSVALFGVIAMSLHEWRRLEVIFAAVILSGLLVSGHAIYQQLTGDLSAVGFVNSSGDVEYRVTSVFSHPNQLAGYVAILVPVAAVLSRFGSRRWLRWAAGVLVVLGILTVFVTYSRGALVGLLALPLLVLRAPRLWPLLLATLLVTALLLPGTWRSRIAGASRADTPEVATRLDVWRAAVDAFGERPVAGWGINNFPNAYVALEATGRNFLGTGQFDVPQTAHSLYLNTAAEQGLLGLVALIALGVAFLRMTSLLRHADDARKRAIGVALLGAGLVLAVHNAFDVTFTEPKTSTLVWALLGVGAGLWAKRA